MPRKPSKNTNTKASTGSIHVHAHFRTSCTGKRFHVKAQNRKKSK